MRYNTHRMPDSPHKVAIVYDRINKFGGAERVLLTLKKIYPHAVLFTSVYDRQNAPWVGDWIVKTTFLQYVPFAKQHHEWFALWMPLAFELLDLSEYDLVISVTSEFAKNLVTHPSQLHVCYCLTPTRYLWSHTHLYSAGFGSSLKKIGFAILRLIDVASAKRPDAYIAISKLVKTRIEKYYRQTVTSIIYPPVNKPTRIKRLENKEKKYYLCVSRLVRYKQIERALQACILLKKHLYIVGCGSDERRLKKLAKASKYIHFEGKVAQDRLDTLYRGARALICPQVEDFGIVSVEAQMHGTPVLSFKSSGIAETLIDGKTGILFTDDTIGGIMKCLKRSERKTWNQQVIVGHAQKYREDVFRKAFVRKVNMLWKQKVANV